MLTGFALAEVRGLRLLLSLSRFDSCCMPIGYCCFSSRAELELAVSDDNRLITYCYRRATSDGRLTQNNFDLVGFISRT